MLLTTYLYPQYEPHDPSLGGWALDSLPPTFDVISLKHPDWSQVQKVSRRFGGTIVIPIPLWIQRGKIGHQISVAAAHSVGPTTPFMVPENASAESCLYLDYRIGHDLRDGDIVHLTWWAEPGEMQTVDLPIRLVQGPEEGFPQGLWKVPEVVEHLRNQNQGAHLVGYFPPWDGPRQGALARALHRPQPDGSPHAGWIRWGPAPFIVLEALLPKGLESRLEDVGWAVGAMARIAYDTPYGLWIGRGLEESPFQGSSDTWILHHQVPRPTLSAWTLPLMPPLGVHFLEDLPMTCPVAVDTIRWPLQWPGIVLGSTMAYEAFQDWIERTIQNATVPQRWIPIRWGQPDPTPILHGIQRGHRLIVAFHIFKNAADRHTLKAQTQELIGQNGGLLLDMRGWIRSCPQWL